MDEALSALEGFVEDIVRRAMELPTIERGPFVDHIVEAIRASYREHYLNDRQALADAMVLSVKIEEWVQLRLAQAGGGDSISS